MHDITSQSRREDEPPIERLLVPVQRFMELEAGGGIVLLIAAVGALALANSPLSHAFRDIWETHFVIGLQDFRYDKTFHQWINDALMAVFFFVV